MIKNFLISFFRMMSQQEINIMVIRNYEGLPLNITGRDLDFITFRENKKKILKIIYDLKQNINFEIIQVIDKYHLLTLRLIFYNKNIITALTLDFFFYIGWQSACFFEASELLNNYNKYHGIKIPSTTYEPLITIIHHYLWTGYLKKYKYKQQITNILNDSEGKKNVFLILNKYFSYQTINKIILSFNKEFGKITKYEKWHLRIELFMNNLLKKPFLLFKRTIIIIMNEIFYSVFPDGKIIIANRDYKKILNTNEFLSLLKAIDGKNVVLDITSEKMNYYLLILKKIVPVYFKIRRHALVFILVNEKFYTKFININKLYKKIIILPKKGNLYYNIYQSLITK